MPNNKMTYTPGPWVVEVYESGAHAKESGAFDWIHNRWPESKWGKPASVWQEVDGGTTGLPGRIETTEANANLIAAAPDLLEAMQAFIKASASDTGSSDEDYDRMEAAIAKATAQGLR